LSFRRGPHLIGEIDRAKADRIVAVDGRRVKTLDELLNYVESKKPGDRVTLSVIRDGKKMEVPVKLEQAKG
jgi:S1-C subfamily serine protease